MEYKRHKLLSVNTKVVGDPSDGRIHAVVSTENKDRDGDIIRQAGWDTSHFNEHPVLLTSHDYRSLLSQIGEWEDMKVTGAKALNGGPQLEGVARYYVGEGNPEADWGFKLAAKGMAAYSVGFIPDMSRAKELKGEDSFFTNYEFNGQELLEVSAVTIPSNREALQSMAKSMAPRDLDLVVSIIEGFESVPTLNGKPAPSISASTAGEPVIPLDIQQLASQEAFVKLREAMTESTTDITKGLIDLAESIRLARPDDPKSLEQPIILADLAKDTIKKVLAEAGNHGS